MNDLGPTGQERLSDQEERDLQAQLDEQRRHDAGGSLGMGQATLTPNVDHADPSGETTGDEEAGVLGSFLTTLGRFRLWQR